VRPRGRKPGGVGVALPPRPRPHRATTQSGSARGYTGSVGPEVMAMTSAPAELVTVWTQPGGRRA